MQIPAYRLPSKQNLYVLTYILTISVKAFFLQTLFFDTFKSYNTSSVTHADALYASEITADDGCTIREVI